MPDADILERLKRASGAFEVYHRTEYTLYRERKGGGVQEVLVEILDAGPSKQHTRYHVHARSENGATATGNPAESIEVALAIVHWGNLDK